MNWIKINKGTYFNYNKINFCILSGDRGDNKSSAISPQLF